MTKQMNSHSFSEMYKELKIDLDKLGCVMCDLKPLMDVWSLMSNSKGLNLNDEYYSKNKNRYWIKGYCGDEPHVTLLYGLLKGSKSYGKHIETVLAGNKFRSAKIESIGVFESPYEDEPYYCLVAKIEKTPELMDIHQRLSFLPHINTYPEYTPHVTIAYIKKDKKVLAKWKKFFTSELVGKKVKVLEINKGK